MADVQRTVSPIDGSVVAERPLASEREIDGVLGAAVAAGTAWSRTPLAERIAVLERAVDAFVAEREATALELTWQMGRPVSQTPGEVLGFEERARAMLALAPDALADVVPPVRPGFTRFVRREPLGVVLALAPWNYPYLTAVNSVWPALAAGNAVVLKHSHQTPLCAERFAAALAEAGLPSGVFSVLHTDHATVERMLGDARIAFCAFTGSVAGGHAVQGALASRFAACGLELGGKDPAYVRADADLAHAVPNLVDGVFFNSGQSCCGIERIYVHVGVFDAFVEDFAARTRAYRLGSPLDAETDLGPMVRAAAADFVREQTTEAISLGARALIDPAVFDADAAGTPYLAPQVLVDVDHRMRVMHEESFGPVVGIMPVDSDEQAIALMNDSDFGLTASVWTADAEAALAIGARVHTGTWFMNRCDYLDPELAWTGVKDSGRGCTLSRVGYEQLTRPKSFHLRTA